MAGELQQVHTVHNGITASVTAANAVAIPIAGVKKATIFTTVTGSGAWSTVAEVSADGTNFATFNKLIPNLANATANNLTRLADAPATPYISTTDFVTVDLANDAFAWIKIGATEKSGTGSVVVTLVLEYFA